MYFPVSNGGFFVAYPFGEWNPFKTSLSWWIFLTQTIPQLGDSPTTFSWPLQSARHQQPQPYRQVPAFFRRTGTVMQSRPSKTGIFSPAHR